MSQFAEAATKDGLPRSAFAYTPSDEPSTWKLPYLTAAGAPDPDHLPGAAAALSSGGFRGQQADIPSSAMAAVKAKLRQAYRRWGHEPPDSIRESGALVEAAMDMVTDFFYAESADDDEELLLADAERHSIAEASGDDHFYGSWSGGSKGAGGRPGGSGGAASGNQTAREEALNAQMKKERAAGQGWDASRSEAGGGTQVDRHFAASQKNWQDLDANEAVVKGWLSPAQQKAYDTPLKPGDKFIGERVGNPGEVGTIRPGLTPHQLVKGEAERLRDMTSGTRLYYFAQMDQRRGTR